MKTLNPNREEEEEDISENEILQMSHRKKIVLIDEDFQQKEKGLSINLIDAHWNQKNVFVLCRPSG